MLQEISPPVITKVLASGLAMIRDASSRRRISAHDRLHLACGTNVMSGWANIDLEGPRSVIKLDLTRPLPIRSSSMSYVYSEHFIEHIERSAAVKLLAECFRVLKEGGVLRLSTPSLSVLVDEYRSGRLSFWSDMHWTPESSCSLLNEGMRLWGHQYLFDASELESVLRLAGFGAIRAVPWRESAHAPLQGIECRPFHGELIYECVK